MRIFLVLALLLLSAYLALAGDYVGEDTVTPGKFRRYLESRDPTQAIPQTNEVLHAVSEANTPAQRAMNLGQPNAQPPVPPSVPQKYRKVVGGLVVEMDAAEKQAVDNAQAAQEALTQQYQEELTTKDMCKESLLAQVTQFLANREANKHAAVATSQAASQTEIDASKQAFQAEINAMPPPNQAVAIDFFTRVNERLHTIVATKANERMHALTDGMIDDAYILFNNVARCLLAARKVRGG